LAKQVILDFRFLFVTSIVFHFNFCYGWLNTSDKWVVLNYKKKFQGLFTYSFDFYYFMSSQSVNTILEYGLCVTWYNLIRFNSVGNIKIFFNADIIFYVYINLRKSLEIFCIKKKYKFMYNFLCIVFSSKLYFWHSRNVWHGQIFSFTVN